ncbi:MAG: hypothetical protein AAF089_17060 [Bacteroidota bacterium]
MFVGLDRLPDHNDGFPLGLQVFANECHLGLRLYGFVNLNREASFGGVTLALVLGRMQ